MGDGGDRYRTAALRFGWEDYSLGFNLYTGDPGLRSDDRHHPDGTYLINELGDNPDKYRAGILYAGYGNYQYGVNSEGIRHTIQNRWIHKGVTGSPFFKVLDIKRQSHFRVGTNNPFSLW